MVVHEINPQQMFRMVGMRVGGMRTRRTEVVRSGRYEIFADQLVLQVPR